MPKSFPEIEAEGFAKRLIALLEKKQVRRHGAGAYLAAKYKVSGVTANAWLNGTHRPEPETARQIAEDHGGSVEALYFGGEDQKKNFRPHQNVTEGPDLKADVPLISSVTAGHWCNVEDPFRPGDAEAWYPCPKKHGPRTFALRIEGISMMNPGGKPSFDDGDIVFIDPDAQPAPNSKSMQSCVVVRLEDSDRATFKQLIEEGGKRWLRPLNPSWPEKIIEVTSAATICGACIGKWVE